MEHLSDAQVLLLAAQLAATTSLTRFKILAAQRQDILDATLVYRILLTYLPLDADADATEDLTALLRAIQDGFHNFSTLDAEVRKDDGFDILNVQDAEQSLSSLKLERLPVNQHYDGSSENKEDRLSDFLIAWAHKLEDFNGILPSTLRLIDQFVPQHLRLKHWNDSILKPLYRLETDFYPNESVRLSLRDLEAAHGESGVSALLQFAAQSGRAENIGRDMQEVVIPWISGSNQGKRRRLNTLDTGDSSKARTSWSDIDRWLFSTAQNDYSLAAEAAKQWSGPLAEQETTEEMSEDMPHDDGAVITHLQTLLAMIYLSKDYDDDEKIRTKQSLLQRAADLAQLIPPDFNSTMPDIPDTGTLRQSRRSDLFENALLLAGNQLTRPSTDLIDFLYGVLSTQSLLNQFKLQTTTNTVTSIVLFESEERQKQELRTLVAQVPRLTRSSIGWEDVRTRIRWLHDWSHEATQPQGHTSLSYLGRVSMEVVELEILDAMLSANEYQLVKEMFVLAHQPPLSSPVVKQHIKDAILTAYDNASNGNRTRGGVKKASEMLSAFRSSFDDASDLENIEYLIKATHSLSFYQLTLQHGVPFQPVSIRVSSDPISLIGKVLDQNNKAYTKLDDLIGIAHNLVRAGLPTPTPQDFAPGETVPVDRRLLDAEQRITYLAITAALADHDFDTAYSLITSRLTASRTRSNADIVDDTSWRAAYAAGKYRPATSPSDLHKRIASLSQRMDLLSTALTLAPTSEPLPEILATWRRCEEEMDTLKAQAIQEERALDAESDNVLPGGFGPSDRDVDANETKRLLESRRAYNTTGPSYEEEAPLGLFDVARGAANALRKNAFPLRGAAGTGQQGITVSQPRQSVEGSVRSSGESERPGSSDEQQRVRKRDMLSNAVTGTLVGGMSWVLGAQPANQGQHNQH